MTQNPPVPLAQWADLARLREALDGAITLIDDARQHVADIDALLSTLDSRAQRLANPRQAAAHDNDLRMKKMNRVRQPEREILRRFAAKDKFDYG